MACSDGLHCYEFLVSNVSILSFAHGKIADANFPPVVSPADLKCKFTSYNKNTPNISPQKSPVKNISPGAYFRNFTASNSDIQKGCPKTRKPGNPIVKHSQVTISCSTLSIAVQTPVHGMVNSFDKISSTTCDANT